VNKFLSLLSTCDPKCNPSGIRFTSDFLFPSLLPQYPSEDLSRQVEYNEVLLPPFSLLSVSVSRMIYELA
jgi:hypothetical protein